MDDNGLSRPHYEAQPGRCRFCAHPLPYAYAATSVVDDAIKRVEWNEADPISAKLTFNESGSLELGNGVALVHRRDVAGITTHTGLRHIGEHFPTVLLAANGACDALTGEVFRQASAIARDKATKRRTALLTNASAKEIATKRAVAIAAKRLAGTMGGPGETPPPDDGGF